MISTDDAIRRIQSYVLQHGLSAKPLSGGQDGVVWQTSLMRNSVIKAFYREDSFRAELACYQRLAERGIEEIKGYHIPALIGSDEALQVIEIELVEPPFILDFGKARVDYKHDFTPEAMADWEEDLRAMWGEDYWKTIRSIVGWLEHYGIYYPDPRPGNIKPLNWNPSLDDD